MRELAQSAGLGGAPSHAALLLLTACSGAAFTPADGAAADASADIGGDGARDAVVPLDAADATVRDSPGLDDADASGVRDTGGGTDGDAQGSCSTSATRRVFVTSTVYPISAFAGLMGADTLCAAAASSASLGGTYKAWLSDELTNAASRLAHSNVPYVLVNGTTVVACDWNGLIGGNLRACHRTGRAREPSSDGAELRRVPRRLDGHGRRWKPLVRIHLSKLDLHQRVREPG